MMKELKSTIPDTPTTTDGTTQEYVYQRLRYAIMIGAIKPGTTLTIRGLADSLNLSPTPIREAIRRLSTEGAIHVNQTRRISVPLMTLGRFEELVALRIALETHAAERALPYVSQIMIAEMTVIDDRMDRAIIRKDWDQLTQLNQDFRRTLYQANPNQVSMPTIESIWLQIGPFQRQVIEHLEEFYKIDRHKEILSALQSRDAAALINATESDIRESISRAGRKILREQAAYA